MQVILIKYIQVFCFALFLSNKIRCDIMSLDEKAQDRKIYEKAACAARCLESGRNQTLEHCYNNCKGSLAVDIEPVKQVYENLKVNFICRGDTSFVLQIAISEYEKRKDSIQNGIYFQQGQHIYIFKISEANPTAILTTKEIYLTDSRIIKVQNLTANTLYNISATVVHSNNEFSVIAKRIQFSTLERFYKPDKIFGISLSKFNAMDSQSRLLSATINWKPANDLTCIYEILYYATATNSAFGFVQAEVKAPKTLYSYKVENLTFGTEYQIGIRGKNPKETSKESDIFWYNLLTPTCLEWYQNDLNICPPLVPEELNVTEHYIDINKFSINVTWKKPALDPDYYIIKILDLSKMHMDDLRTVTLNISKDLNSVLIPTVTLYGVQYEVHLIALSTGGNASTAVTTTLVRHVEIAEYRHLRLVIALVATIFSVAFLSIVIMVIFQKRAKCKRYQERCRYFEDLDKKAPVDSNSNFNFASKTFSMLPSMEQLNQLQQELGERLFINDELEINRDDIEIFELLGEGAFGLVKRGILKLDKNTKTEIAVKMLKDHPTSDDITAFRREIDVMKAVGKHPNIVGIVGHCTKDIKEMFLLTEFCSLGNLLNFLRSEWKYLNKIIQRRHFTSISAEMYKPRTNNKQENIYKRDFENKSTTSLIINRSYEISGPCTSACKCQVDIISNKCLKENKSSPSSKCNVKIQNCDCNSTAETLLIENKGYYKLLSNEGERAIIFEERQPLRSLDLLHIAKQISLGMEFLAKNKVVHRDLAARNILVCKDRTVKIADFGLSRDVYQENMYKKTGNGKLPIKWLALESMTHQVYTTQSDVWSYGVLLFEIVTLGGTPYPLIQTNKLLNLLKTGYRMEKPKNCGQEIYNLMLSCWNAIPNERPNFTSICKTIDDLITSSSRENIISLNFAENNESKARPLSEESYLKPL